MGVRRLMHVKLGVLENKRVRNVWKPLTGCAMHMCVITHTCVLRPCRVLFYVFLASTKAVACFSMESSLAVSIQISLTDEIH